MFDYGVSSSVIYEEVQQYSIDSSADFAICNVKKRVLLRQNRAQRR